MTRRFALLLPLLLLAPAASQAGDRPWTSDDVLGLKVVSDPRVSPDGRLVAYVVESLNAEADAYQTDVWLVRAASGEARPLAASPVGDDTPRWSPDGRWVAFLSERPRPGVKPEEAGEAKRQIWLIRPDGGEAVPLTSAPGSVSTFEWSADGRLVAFLAREAKSDERKRHEKEKDDAWTPSEVFPWERLWVIDVATRQARQLTSGEIHVTGMSFSPDGRTVAFAGQPTPRIPDRFRSDLYTVPTAGGAPSPLVVRKGMDVAPAWSPDGRWIAFVSQDGRDEDWYTNSSVSVVPAAGGQPRSLTPSLDEQIGGLFGSRLEWKPDSGSIVFPVTWRTSGRLYRATLDGKVEPLTSGPEVNGAPSIDGRGETLVFLREDSVTPREVWAMPLGTPAGPRAAGGRKAAPPVPKALTDTNPQVRGLLAFPKEVVTWTGAEGRAMEGLLVFPQGYVKGTRVPLVLNVHGGPAGTHSNTFTAARIWAWPLFAQRGYAIFFPNPRGSGGYGEGFRAANVRDWGVKDYEDLMKGVDEIVQRGIADPDRLSVNGWSYGGFMTSTIVTKTARFKSAIVGAAVTDLASFTGTTDIPEFAHSYFRSWPWEDPGVYVERSALFHAGNVKTPSLVVHGDKDERVPFSQGLEFYEALRAVGVPTDLLVLPRQPHGPREPKLLRTCHEWFLRWTETYTRGR
ncbi:MAG TPA: S9 family peptidase [Vicinamibacteria bacterium]|nr:S9 family peptidase [Vicinamibacteria bacterium]